MRFLFQSLQFVYVSILIIFFFLLFVTVVISADYFMSLTEDQHRTVYWNKSSN